MCLLQVPPLCSSTLISLVAVHSYVVSDVSMCKVTDDNYADNSRPLYNDMLSSHDIPLLN